MTAPSSAPAAALRAWLEARVWRAFDVDDDGRVLAGSDETGAVQLVELDGGRSTPLTSLPGAVTGRYLPGERVAVVQHDEGGDENAQLSLLPLDPLPGRPATLADLQPLVREPGTMHRLLDVLPGHVVYATNRRNRVDFDVVVHRVGDGHEDVVYDGGGNVFEAAVAPGGLAVALGVASSLPMSQYVVVVADGAARTLTPTDRPGRHERLPGPRTAPRCWSPPTRTATPLPSSGST